MFVPGSNITIGKFKRVKPHEVKITKSIFEYVDKAVLKVPVTARIKRAGEVITVSAETAKQFGEGDKVSIELGYNGSLKNEFTGFISRVDLSTPLEVHCEGYSYQLRKKTLTGTVKNIELKEVLKLLIKDTDIILDKNIPGFKLDKLILQGKDGCRILEEIKGASRQHIRFYFSGNVLYAGLLDLNVKATVKYKIGYNVIKDNNLKLRQSKYQQVEVNWIGEKKDGTKVRVKSGKGGVVKTHTSHMITDKDSLQKLSDAEHKNQSYDGYEGKITAFGIPYCEPGYKVALTDDRYPERSGNYLAENIEVMYSTSGFRRTIGIGMKL